MHHPALRYTAHCQPYASIPGPFGALPIPQGRRQRRLKLALALFRCQHTQRNPSRQASLYAPADPTSGSTAKGGGRRRRQHRTRGRALSCLARAQPSTPGRTRCRRPPSPPPAAAGVLLGKEGHKAAVLCTPPHSCSTSLWIERQSDRHADAINVGAAAAAAAAAALWEGACSPSRIVCVWEKGDGSLCASLWRREGGRGVLGVECRGPGRGEWATDCFHLFGCAAPLCGWMREGRQPSEHKHLHAPRPTHAITYSPHTPDIPLTPTELTSRQKP